MFPINEPQRPIFEPESQADVKNDLSRFLSAYEGSSVYQFDNEIVLNWYPQRILSRVSADVSLLELGLGHGFASRAFEGKVREHHVVEGSEVLVRNFHSNFPASKTKTHVEMFEHFEPRKPYDVIVMGFVLEHVENPLDLLARYRGFLAPGGRLFVSVPNMLAMNRRLGVISGQIENPAELSSYDLQLGHRRLYTVETLQDALRQSGLVPTLLEGLFLKPLMTSQLTALNLSEDITHALCVLGIDYPELSVGLLAEAVAD